MFIKKLINIFAAAALLSVPAVSHAYTEGGVTVEGGAFGSSITTIGGDDVITGQAIFNIDGDDFSLDAWFCLDDITDEFDPTCNGGADDLELAGGYSGTIECLESDESTGTVWISGTIDTVIPDGRAPDEFNDQAEDATDAGEHYFLGRFKNNDADSLAEERSVFLNQYTVPYPNPIMTDGTVFFVGHLQAFVSAVQDALNDPFAELSGENACRSKDGGMLEADYVVVDGSNNLIKWLNGKNGKPVGMKVEGNASEMANPSHNQAVYSIAGISRQLETGLAEDGNTYDGITIEFD